MNRKFIRFILVAFIFVAVLAGGLSLLITSDYLRERIATAVEGTVNAAIDQQFSIGKMEGNLITGVTFLDVSIEVDNETFVGVERISTSYSLPLLVSVIFRGDIPLYDTRVEGVEVNLIKDENEIWNFEKLRDEDRRRSDNESAIDVADTGKKVKNINLYFQNSHIDKGFLRIIDKNKDDVIEFEISDSSFSIDLLGIHERFLLDSENINIDIRPFGINIENLSANALITKDNVAFRDLEVMLNGIMIQGQGILNDFKNPAFDINAYIDSFSPGDAGDLNIYIKAAGNSREYREYFGELQLSFLDSYVKGERVWTDLETIVLDGTKAFIKGDINTEFSNAYVDGYVDLKGMLGKEGENSFSFDSQISHLELDRLFMMFDIADKSHLKDDRLIVESALTANGRWDTVEDIITELGFSYLNLIQSGERRISLNGQAQVSRSEIELNIDSTLSSLDISKLYKIEDITTDLNADLSFYGIIPLEGDMIDRVSFDARTQLSESRINDWTIDEATISAAFMGRILTLNTLRVVSSDLLLTAHGKGTKQNGLDIAYMLKSENLEFLNNLSEDLDVSGSVNAEGTLIGNIDNPEITVISTVRNFKYGNLIRLYSGDVNLKSHLSGDLEGLNVNANLNNLLLPVMSFDFVNLSAVMTDDGIYTKVSSEIDRNKTLNAEVLINNLLGKDKSLVFTDLILDHRGQKLSLSEPSVLRITESGIDIDGILLNYEEGIVQIAGRYGFDGELNLQADLSDIDNSLISIFGDTTSTYRGISSANIRASGTLESPVINAVLRSDDPGINDNQFSYILAEIKTDRDRLNIKLESEGTKNEKINAEGSIRMNLDLRDIADNLKQSDMNINLVSSGFDISVLSYLTDEISELKGEFNADLRIRGALLSPEFYGDAYVRDMMISVRSIANPLNMEELNIRGDGRRAVIGPSTITSESGDAKLEGNVNLENLTYEISVELNHIFLRPRLVTTNMSGFINIKGDEDNRIRIEGDLEARNTTVTLVDEPGTMDAGDIRFVDETLDDFDEFILSDETERDFYTQNVSMKIDLKVPRNSWVKGKGANVEIAGDITLEKQYGANHYVSGTIDVIRGHYIVFGKLFRIEDGGLTFPADGSLTPLLDIHVSHRVSDVEVHINILGTADDPRLNLSSNPPMEESDIISYVLFGTSRDNLGGPQRNVAGEIASSIAAGEVAGFIGHRFGLDVITIHGGETGGLADPQIRAGSYISDDIYLGYERTRSTLPGADNDMQNIFILEWMINRSFSLESQVGGENSGVDIFYNFNF